jgi:hypothetical protein
MGGPCGQVPIARRKPIAALRELELDLGLRSRLDPDLELVGEIEGHEDALELVVAVGAPAHDPQAEVQLGGCEDAHSRYDPAAFSASTKRMRSS